MEVRMRIQIISFCFLFISCTQMNIVSAYKNTKDIFESAQDGDSQVSFDKHLEIQYRIKEAGNYENIKNENWEDFRYLVQIAATKINDRFYKVNGYNILFLNKYEHDLADKVFVVAEPAGIMPNSNTLQFEPRLICPDNTFHKCFSITNNYRSSILDDGLVNPPGTATKPPPKQKCIIVEGAYKCYKVENDSD